MPFLSYVFVGIGIVKALASQANLRITSGLRPRTYTAYLAMFKHFLALVVFMRLHPPHSLDTIFLYLEYIAQNHLKLCSLCNQVSVLKHYFASSSLSIDIFSYRKVQLLLSSVQINVKMQICIKGVFTIPLLEKLVNAVKKFQNGQVYKTVSSRLFPIFRLASLLPDSSRI